MREGGGRKRDDDEDESKKKKNWVKNCWECEASENFFERFSWLNRTRTEPVLCTKSALARTFSFSSYDFPPSSNS